ncbi:sigma factor [Photobacterium sanguinicancri]|uniref:RNA polymerase sigma-70 region 2 domain-containing protein n=2 Tax=Photobacterium sanguinicancri TaxID=875932 RepID=A0ABX4FTH8_9GAMM|nr:sigma factor [Photobacterium sanguinicancri]OZS41630.1 hypothetical protein ASV53_22735 [Photobacterium sanguinicancri]
MLAEWLRHKDQLRYYVLKKIDDPDAAEDILQDVYIKASANLSQLKSQDSLKSWLYRITHNVMMDFYRTRQPYDELPDDIAVEELTSEDENLQKMA